MLTVTVFLWHLPVRLWAMLSLIIVWRMLSPFCFYIFVPRKFNQLWEICCQPECHSLLVFIASYFVFNSGQLLHGKFLKSGYFLLIRFALDLLYLGLKTNCVHLHERCITGMYVWWTCWSRHSPFLSPQGFISVPRNILLIFISIYRSTMLSCTLVRSFSDVEM